MSRAGFRDDDRIEGTDDLICLDFDTQPATETSLAPEPAVPAGATFDELVEWMVEAASIGR